MHFLSDYVKTLQKVTGSRDYAPRLLAEEILTEETHNGPLGTMINVLHGQDSAAKTRLRLQLKGMKGGQEAANLLQSIESELRARTCNTLAGMLVSDDWVRIGGRAGRQSADSTNIDFMTNKMALLMGTANPRFFFRLDIRRKSTIELKLFFENPEVAGPGKPLSSPQQELMAWSGAEWCALTEKKWNLGQALANGGVGQKMAVMTFGGGSTTIVRKMPAAEDIERVRAWLANVVCFVDRKVDEMLGVAA